MNTSHLNSSTSYMQGYFSNLNQSNANPMNVSQSMVFYDKARFEAEIFDLKKEMRRKDTENEKQKAILQQKVELLELQLKESQEREQNIKKMHETLMSAFQNDNSSSSFKTPRAYEYSQGIHKREISEIRIDYENQMKELRNQFAIKDAQCKDSHIQMESQQIDHQRKVQELELDKRDLENKIKKVELEKQQYLMQVEAAQSQTSQIQDYKDLLEDKQIEIERLKIHHENQVQDIKSSHNKQINEHEDQIQHLKNKVNQMENEIQQKYQNQLKIQQDKYIKEVEELQNQLYENQRRQREEVMMIMQERDELAEKSAKLERQLDKLKNAPQPVTVHLSEENFNTSRSSKQKQQRLEEENEYLNTQLNKITNQLKEAREDSNQYQCNERQLKKEISARLDEIDQQRMDFQRKINEERRKYSLLEDEMASMRIELDRKKNEFVSILNDKDSMIQDLKRDIIEQSKINLNLNSMMMPQSPIPQGNQSMNASRDFNIGFNKMINPRSVSPNLSNFPDPKNYLGEPPAFNNQASISQQRNHGIKRYNSGNSQNQMSSFNITNINHQSSKNVNLPLGSQGTTLASHKVMVTGDQLQTQTGVLTHRLTHTELKLYQSCQKMVDAASKMECAQCMGVFPTTYFYDHIVSSQSQCAQIINENQIQSNRSQTRVALNGGIQEDFTLCLEEESMLHDCKNIMLESHNNFQNTLQKMTQTARSRAAKAQMMNRSKEFIQSNLQKYPQRDKFAMTHGSADFKMLKTSHNNPNFFRDNSGSKDARVIVNVKKNYDRFVEDFNTNESYLKDSRIPKPQKKAQIQTIKSPKNLFLETPSSQDEEMQIKGNFRHQISNYDTVNIQHQGSLEQQFSSLQGQDLGYDTNDVKEEDEYYEEDSITKEDRIRRVENEANDVGDEGNKSTYLRPSKNNKSANDVNKSHLQDPKQKKQAAAIEKNASNQKSSSKKYKVPLKLGINKENNIQRNINFNKANTSKARGGTNQYPLTFRHQQAINDNYYQNQHSDSINDVNNKKSSTKKKVNRNPQNDKSKQDELSRDVQKMPYTQKKGGNRYNALLRCSQSATGVNQSNSFVSPKNLMFGQHGQHKEQQNLVDISDFSSQQLASPNQKDQEQIQYNSQHLNSTSSGCIQSDLISPQHQYINPSEQQLIQDYETNNENELVINSRIQGKFQIHDPRNQTQRIEAHLDQILMDDDCDLFGNYVITGFNGGMTSSRHVGTHELQPNLIAQQENKFATLSTNNLVVYDSLSIKQQDTQYQNMVQEQYFTQGSTSSNNVVIQQNKVTSNNNNTRRSKVYNSTQNLNLKSPGTIREKQMYVIRESCPSPLGEDEMIDDLGCPFDQTHGTSQMNISQYNQHFAKGLPSAKQPNQHQDQVVHVLPLPKFIKTIPLMRMRSITQMNVNRQL